MRTQLELVKKAFAELQQSVQADKDKSQSLPDSAGQAQIQTGEKNREREREIFRMLMGALERAKRLLELLEAQSVAAQKQDQEEDGKGLLRKRQRVESE